MNIEHFIAENRAGWQRLENILVKASKDQLSNDDLMELAPLYRRTVVHLAQAQGSYPEGEVTVYLNGLVSKAHGLIYRKEGIELSGIWRFVGRDFPKLFWEQGFWIIVSFVLLFLGFLIGVVLYYVDFPLAAKLFPGSLQDIVDGLQKGKIGSNLTAGQQPIISAVIMINNIRVAALAFALGITGGIGTTLMIVSNGIILGSLAALFFDYKHSLEFWALILPHGVIELTAIVIAGGAGFIFAKALVKPGDYTRKDAIKIAGSIAFKLLLGVIPFFIIAAIIEGFLTPADLKPLTKVLFGATTALVLVLYLGKGRWELNKGGRVK